MQSLRRYSIYGHTLATDHPMVSFLQPTEAEPDLVFTCSQDPVPQVVDEPTVYDSQLTSDDGEPIFRLFRSEAGFRLRYAGTADFHIGREAIHCSLYDASYAYWVEIALLGPVMAFWLELRGSIALHASAVVHDGTALGFLAVSKSGKTSIAAAFMEQGDELLTDDILPVRVPEQGGVVQAVPGYPQLRLWPAETVRFAGDPDCFPRAHPEFEKRRVPAQVLGGFRNETVPLAALFVPERRDGAAVEIVSLPGPLAVATLLRSSFAVSVLEAMPDMQQQRLMVVANIIGRIPVCSLRYAPGYERLPEVRDAVLRWVRDR